MAEIQAGWIGLSSPSAAWRHRSVELRHAGERLEAAGLDALRFCCPGTDLTVGLLAGMRWHGGGMQTA